MAPPKQGRLRRLLFGGPPQTAPADDLGDPILAGPTSEGSQTVAIPAPAEHVIDIRPITPPDIETVYVKVQRLETGVRLVADTMKRAYVELADSLETIRQRLDRLASASDIRRYIEEAVEPLNQTVLEIVESSEGLPIILTTAADRMVEQIREARLEIEQRLSKLPSLVASGTDLEAPSGASTVGSSPARTANVAEAIDQVVGETLTLAAEEAGDANDLPLEYYAGAWAYSVRDRRSQEQAAKSSTSRRPAGEERVGSEDVDDSSEEIIAIADGISDLERSGSPDPAGLDPSDVLPGRADLPTRDLSERSKNGWVDPNSIWGE